MSAIRTWVLAAGAAALVSSQAAYAAPVNTAPAIDPLLAVSALSTGKSPAAVCGATTACSPAIAASAATSAAAAQGDYAGRPIDWPGLAVLFSFPLILILIMATQDGNESISASPD